MSVTVAKFLDVADGLQANQFSIGDHYTIDSISDLDPIYKQLMDRPIPVILGGDRRRRSAQPDADVVRLRRRQGAGQRRRRIARRRVDPQDAADDAAADQPGEHVSLAEHQGHGRARDQRGRSGRGQAGDRAAQPHLDANISATARTTRCAIRRSTSGACCSSAGSTGSPPSASREARRCEPRTGRHRRRVARRADRRPACSRDAGLDVTVYERSPAELRAARRRHRASCRRQLSLPRRARRRRARRRSASSTGRIRYLGRDGCVVHDQAHRYRFSSWNTVYRRLLGCFDRDRYRLGHEVDRLRAPDDAGARRRFADGVAIEADLLVCADGVGSARAADGCCPDVGRRLRRLRRLARHGAGSASSTPALAAGSATRSPTTCTPTATSCVYPIPGPGRLGGAGRAPDQLRLVSQLPRRRATSTTC